MANSISRRDFLGFTAGNAALIALAGGSLGAAESTNERRRPKGLKLSCSSLAFSDRSWEEALGEIRKLGFRYADLAMFEGWTHVFPSKLTDPEGHGKRIAQACDRIGIEPIALHGNFKPEGSGEFPGLTTPDATLRKAVLSHFERVAACARAAGIPLVNVQPGSFLKVPSRGASIGNAIEALKGMVGIAKANGVGLSFENHTGSIAQDPKDALAILEAVPGLLLDYDPSHVVACSIRLEDTFPLLKRVGHVGIRNARPGSYNEPILEGKLSYPLKPFIDAFRAAEVSAFISVEYYEPKMRENIPRLKEILEREGISAA